METRHDAGHGEPLESVFLLVDSTTVHNHGRFLNDYRGRFSGSLPQQALKPNAVVLNFEVAGGVPCVCVIAARDIAAREQILVSSKFGAAPVPCSLRTC